jgi:cell division protease FtsH
VKAARTMPIAALPTAISVSDAVEAACAADLTFIEERLAHGSSVLVECDKELALHLYLALRARLKRRPDCPRLTVIDGRPGADDPPRGVLGQMLAQLTDAIRGSLERSVLVLLHLDVLTTTHSALTMEAREAIPLLYENPEVVLLGFRDPSFEIPRVIEGVFHARRSIVGVPRETLHRLITQREARALDGEAFDPYALYKYVSGLNPVRLRRVLGALAHTREALPGRSAQHVYRSIRQQTVAEDVELPNVRLEEDIGGYEPVKARLRDELIDLLRRKDALPEQADIQAVEELVPRGIVFHGPPGTGKTYFAKAIATALDATVFIVSGPELKSKWVGESEENIRRVFRHARQAAPSVVVFDEIDAFAHARGTYQGSGVEHSMVNQLLTEMDGFRSSELVVVVGTTNFLESLDRALLRPGRFEFLIEVPAPTAEDRAAIIRIHERRLGLKLGDDLVAHLVRRTAGLADRAHQLPFTGDHLNAVCRALKRQALRTGQSAFTSDDIDRALERRTRQHIALSAEEERVIAVHEAGHALCAMLLPEATPPEKITITPDAEGALGYVLRAAHARPYTLTTKDMRAEICVGLGGYAAERICLGQTSIGSATDLRQATQLAHAMVEEYGMSLLGPQVSLAGADPAGASDPSEARRKLIDEEIDRLMREELARAEELVSGGVKLHQALVSLLLEQKTIEARRLIELKAKAEE